MKEEEDNTIVTLNDRAKGSADCLITILQLLKASSALLLWVDIYGIHFMITVKKDLQGSSCTSHSISLSYNGFLQMPTPKLKIKNKNCQKVSGCEAHTQTVVTAVNLEVMVFYSNQTVKR